MLFCKSRKLRQVLALPINNSKTPKPATFQVVSMCDMPDTLCFQPCSGIAGRKSYFRDKGQWEKLTALVSQTQNCHQLPTWQVLSYRMASALGTMKSAPGMEKEHLGESLRVLTGSGRVGGGAWSSKMFSHWQWTCGRRSLEQAPSPSAARESKTPLCFSYWIKNQRKPQG